MKVLEEKLILREGLDDNLPISDIIDFIYLGHNLESFKELDRDDQEELISDYLSDEYGFCHNGFKWRIVEKPDDDYIKVTNIKWDLEESLNEDDEEEIEIEEPIEELPDVVPSEPIVVPTEPIEEIPQEVVDNSIASVLNALIIDEFDAIEGYNSAISTLTLEDKEKYSSIINILMDIVNEENIHVGQLQEALKMVSDSAKEIETGQEEAKEQVDSKEESPKEEKPIEKDEEEE